MSVADPTCPAVFALPAISALVMLVYARPQEFFESLQAAPLLYVFLGLALFGMVLDLRLGNTRLAASPQLPWVGLLWLWSAVGAMLRSPREALPHVRELAICVALYVVIAHGLQTFRALHIVAGVVLAMVLFVSAVGAHQGFAPTGCVLVNDSTPGDTSAGAPDGRPCTTARECYREDPEPGAEYVCERIGLLGTTSVGQGRVRYRGVLQDPNELALAGGIGLPLALGLRQSRRNRTWRIIVAALTFVVVLTCAVLTRSRGGQIVCLTVLGAYFAKRFGVRGLLLGAVIASPLLLLGGRGGEEASRSTIERIECWAEAIAMWRTHPVFGVGLGQFGEYHYMTAHNSYLLPLAELGFPGMLLFSIVLYLSSKIPLMALRRAAFPHSARSASGAGGVGVIEPSAMALLAAFTGLWVGMFFLSFTYHYVLWIYMGLSGALYSAVRRHDPDFRVRFGRRDAVLVVSANVATIALVFLYTRAKLGGS
jgi:hypothetical protein